MQKPEKRGKNEKKQQKTCILNITALALRGIKPSKTMKIRKEVIERILGRKDIIPIIAQEMGVTRLTVKSWLYQNRPDGALTTVKVVTILREKLELTDDIILEAETQKPL